MNIQTFLPYLALLVVLLLLYFRTRKPYRLRPRSLWITPLLATLLVASAVFIQPHEPFGVLAYAGFGVCIIVGTAIGLLRAHSINLWLDPASGQVMAKASSLALLLIGAVFVVRAVLREVFDPTGQNAAAINALLLFALAMIIAQRVVMWKRYRVLRSASSPAA